MHVVIINWSEICSHAGQLLSSHLCIRSGVGLQILPVETVFSISGLRPSITAHFVFVYFWIWQSWFHRDVACLSHMPWQHCHPQTIIRRRVVCLTQCAYQLCMPRSDWAAWDWPAVMRYYCFDAITYGVICGITCRITVLVVLQVPAKL